MSLPEFDPGAVVTVNDCFLHGRFEGWDCPACVAEREAREAELAKPMRSIDEQATREELEALIRHGEIPPDPFSHRDSRSGEWVTHVSPSMLTCATRCLEQYRRRYRKGEKDPPSGVLLWGRADHSAVAWDMRQFFMESRHQPAGAVMDMFAAEVDREVHEAEEIKWGDLNNRPLTKGKVKDIGTKLVKAFMEDVAPVTRPLEIEAEIRGVEIPGLGIPFTGYVDLKAAVATAEGERRRIIERKTVGRNDLSGSHRFQVELYQLADPIEGDVQLSLRQVTNPRVVHGVHIIVPDRQRALYKARSVILRIANAWLMHGDDEPWPDAMAGGFACSWCGWGPKGNNTCPYWNAAHWNPSWSNWQEGSEGGGSEG